MQQLQTPLTPGFNWGAGVWGSEAYWNNNIYFGGTNAANAANYTGEGNSLSAYSFVNGVLSTTPTSQSPNKYTFGILRPTPTVSANGNEQRRRGMDSFSDDPYPARPCHTFGL